MKISRDDVFEDNFSIFEKCDSILSLAETIGKVEENFRKGLTKTKRERLEEENEFLYKPSDIPDKVINSYRDKKGNIFLKVSFKQRSNGIIPKPSKFSVRYLASSFPNFLLDYYESKLI